MTDLDVVGPMEVLRFVPGAQPTFVAEASGPVATDCPGFVLTATARFGEVDAAVQCAAIDDRHEWAPR